ncbi:YihY/virulence factor BrkB family protein [Granulicella arctica]|uniref:YihY/virulence factor BrkB family protein n=1 Tax=Granulicella arctica TaxID=940613 RepID=UPI0021E00501|nr:YihY/virulence factor BrkB family protein [Granulicella arctica]
MSSTPQPITLQHVMPHRLGRILIRSIARALDHDCVNIGQSSAYSAMVALFPALIVAAAAVSLLPDSTPLRSQMSIFFDRILPPDVSPILQSYFVTTPNSSHSAHALIVAAIVSLSGASGVIATLMEGIRRAHQLPEDCWTFWQRRIRALILVPLSLLPLFIASFLVVFGQLLTAWLATHVMESMRTPVFLLAFLIRWTVALTGSVGLIALLYHAGTPKRQLWRSVLPGAIMATALWFVTTLVFGWYVTRFANYSQVYGSLGAGIALLFWLYIICLSVLCGAEFNVQFQSRFNQDVPPVA